MISKSGHVVLRRTVSAAAAAFSLKWNGRNAKGAVLAAGTYRVSLTPHDRYGGQGRTVVIPATLSHRRAGG